MLESSNQVHTSNNMRVLVFLCTEYGWLTMPGRIYSTPSVISSQHTLAGTTLLGTWLHSAEQQAEKLGVNRMKAQTWPIQGANFWFLRIQVFV